MITWNGTTIRVIQETIKRRLSSNINSFEVNLSALLIPRGRPSGAGSRLRICSSLGLLFEAHKVRSIEMGQSIKNLALASIWALASGEWN